MESETADAELKLNDATQRLQQLEQDVMQLRDKASNASQSAHQTERDADGVRKIAEEVKKVSPRDQALRPHALTHPSQQSPCPQELDSEIKDKYATVEQLISTKAVGVADARKRAQLLQQEAKELLLKASAKLQQLKGAVSITGRSGATSVPQLTFVSVAVDLEKSYEDNQRTLEMKAEQLVELEAAVKGLLAEISHKVTVYSTCVF